MISPAKRRANRVAARPMLMAALVAQAQYRRALRAILGEMHQEAERELEPFFKDMAAKQDAKAATAPHAKWKKKLDELAAKVPASRQKTGKAFDLMAQRVRKANFQAAKQLLGVTPTDQGVEEAISGFRKWNMDLIDKAAYAYYDDMADILMDPKNFGISIKDLMPKVQQAAQTSQSRAELIARDQTLKLNGQLNQIHQTSAGITHYTWSTSHDERVRPEHAELDGQTFSWGSPPLIHGEPLNPGEDFQCRCVAIPVVDELADI